MKKANLIFLVSIILISCKKNTETVIFSSSRNGNSDIFMMNADGSNQIALTKNETEEWGPTWINKNEISFLRQKKEGIQRIKLNLTTLKETEQKHPDICILDDKNILYHSLNSWQLFSCKNNIYIYNTKSLTTKNITKDFNKVAAYPSWSKDGKSILFTSNHLGTNDIFRYDLSSEKISQLTNSENNNERGELSPNGKLLVYSSDYLEKGNQDIILKDLATGALKNISSSPGFELIARFSSDGNGIFYGSNKNRNWEIYFYNLTNSETIQLTKNEAFDGDPRILK